jgi:esterase
MNNPLLSYKSFGDEANSSCIVLLHGMLGNRDNWRSQARRLSTHFRVITPDLRNHGDSPHFPGMRYQDMAADVLALMDHLGIKQFDLLGHSMGGKVAMEIALNHAERLERLIIVDIAPKSYQLWHLGIFKALLSLPVADLTSRNQADEMLSEHIENPFERSFLLKNLKSNDDGGYSWQCNLKEITRAYLNIANFTQSEQSSFDGETLFVSGEKSPYIDIMKDTSTIKSFFPTSSIQTIQNAGHTPHIEKADEFYKVMSEFLALS